MALLRHMALAGSALVYKSRRWATRIDNPPGGRKRPFDKGARHVAEREKPGEVDGGIHRHPHHRAVQARLSQHLHPGHPSPQSRRAGDGRSGLYAALHSGAGRPRSSPRVRRPRPSPAQGGGRMSARTCLRDRQPPQRVGGLRRRNSGHAAVEARRRRHRHRRRFARLAPDRAHAVSRLSRRGGGADQPDQTPRCRPRRPDRLRRGAGLSRRHRGRRRRGRCGDPPAHRRRGGGGGVRANRVRGFRAGEGRARPLDLRHLSPGTGGARGVQALARGQWPLSAALSPTVTRDDAVTQRKENVMKHLAGLVLTLGIALAPSMLRAQDAWPTRPITFVVPYGAGGYTDLVGRLTARYVEKVLGKPVIVDNRAGAGGIVGTQAVANAAADGYVFCVCSIGAISTAPFDPNQKVSYDPLRDLAPVGVVSSIAQVVIVRKDLPVKTLAELVSAAKAK